MQIWLLIGCRSLRPSFSGQFHGFFQRLMERQQYWKGGKGLITVRKLIWELLEAVPRKILCWFSLYGLKCLMRNAFLPLPSGKFDQIYIWFSKKLYICWKVLKYSMKSTRCYNLMKLSFPEYLFKLWINHYYGSIPQALECPFRLKKREHVVLHIWEFDLLSSEHVGSDQYFENPFFTEIF